MGSIRHARVFAAPRRARVAIGIAGASLMLGAGGALASAATATNAAIPVLGLHPKNGVGPPVSAAGWASTNWSGYAVSGSGYHAITGKWTVPSVARTTNATYSAAWAGIDGFSNNSLIQTGTEQDYYSGSSHYAAWWTTSAQNFAEQPIAEPVSPGDLIDASIVETNAATSQWTITLTDASGAHGWTFTKVLTYTGPGTSAEWIMEAPTVGGRIAPLAVYQSPTAFDPGTLNGGSPGLTASESGQLVVSSRHRYQAESTPSLPDSDVDGFNVAYGASVPPAPAS